MTAERLAPHGTIFPVANAERYFHNLSGNLERHGDTLRWPSHDGITEFSIERIDQPTADGLVVSELVILRHSSPLLQRLCSGLASVASHLNTWATLSALIPGEDGAHAQLVAKIGVFSKDRESAERVYAPLICQEGAVIGWHAAMLARGQSRSDPNRSPLSMTDQAPPFDDADFEAIKSITDHYGFVGSLGKLHFTVELPWEVGASSSGFAYDDGQEFLSGLGMSEEDRRRAGGKTSLLQILVMDHPFYGRGVQCRLEIPYLANGDATSRLVDALNRWELSGPDLPPFLGAWCLGSRAPAFVTFVPTQLCFRGLLDNLVVWGVARHFHVRDFIVGTEAT